MSRSLGKRWYTMLRVGLGCCLLSISALAQIAPAPPEPKISDQYHTAWTVRDGLPSTIWDVAQDTDGFLWISSESGLFRFDGVKFEKYKPAAGYHLLSNNTTTIAALLAPSTGGLWVAYQFGGVSFIRGGVVTNFESSNTAYHSIEVMAQDLDGNVWATTHFGVFRFDGTTWKSLGPEWGLSATVFDDRLYVDLEGNVWVSDTQNFLTLRRGDRRFQEAGVVSGFFALPTNRSDPVWMVHFGGIDRLLPDKHGGWVTKDSGLHGSVQSLLARADGSLWLVTADDGISRVETPLQARGSLTSSSSGVQTFRQEDGLTSNFVFRLREDREGDLWALTENGMDRFRQVALKAVQLPPQAKKLSMLATGDSLIIGSSYGSELTMMRLADGKVVPMKGSPTHVEVLFQDAAGSVWMAARNKLWHFVNGAYIAIAGPDELPASGRIQSLTVDRSGVLWLSLIGNCQYRVFSLDHGKWSPFKAAPDPHNPTAIVMMPDTQGATWLGFNRNLIAVVNHGSTRIYRESDGLNVGVVAALYERGNHVWAGGSEGLDYFTNGRFQEIYTDEGDRLSGVSGIIETAKGELWLNTSLGIVQISAPELQAALRSPQHRAKVKIYNYLDGALGTPEQYSPLPSLAQTEDGKLYFLSRDSVTWIDPNHIAINPIRPSVFITSSTVDGKVVIDPQDLQLDKGAQNLQIDYTATSLLIPERVRFRYKLEGFDRDWQQAGTRRQAFYSKLPPGKYVFRVLACNNDDVWNMQGSSLSIHLPPTFIQSWPFKILCAFIALLLLRFLYLYRVNQATAQVKRRMFDRLAERERIARDLHDTIFQGIQGLLLRFHTVTEQLSAEEPARPLLQEALNQSDRVMLEGRELVLDLRTTTIGFNDLPAAFAAVGEECQKTWPARFNVILNGELCALQSLNTEEIYRIGREALLNAFQHAKARVIEVELNYTPFELRIRFRDDGRGIDPGVLDAGHRADHWGLPGMRERAKKIGIRLDIWSREGAGTELELRIPAAIAYQSKGKKSPFGLLKRLSVAEGRSHE